MNSQYTDRSSGARPAGARACAGKAIIAGCIVSLVGIAPGALAQVAPPTHGGSGSGMGAPASAGAMGAAGSAGLSVGTLAAIGAGVLATASIAPAASSFNADNDAAPPPPGVNANLPPLAAPGQHETLNGSGAAAPGAAGPGATGVMGDAASGGATGLFDPAAGPVNTPNSGGPEGMSGPATASSGKNSQVAPPASASAPAPAPAPASASASNQATFNALVSAGAIRRDKSGGYAISPTITPAQMATLIALSWNAIQATGIDVRQVLAALAKEQALDQHPSHDKPTDKLTLLQLQRQMAEDLKLQLASEKQKRLRDLTKEFNDEMQQYVQNAVANDVQRQKQLDAVSGGSSSGFPYIAVGFVTPQSSYPTNLTATYNGSVNGVLSNAGSVSGALSMTVNFANLGSIPGSINFANGQGTANFALTGNGGLIGGQLSGNFAGEMLNAGSNISGKFYGPVANEVGGVWNLNTTSNTGGGQFAGKR